MATSNGPWQNHARIEWVYSSSSVGQGSTHSQPYAEAYLRAEANWDQYYTGSKSWSGQWGSGSASQYYGFDRSGPRALIVYGGGSAVALADTVQVVSFSVTANHFFGSTSSTVQVGIPARYAVTPTGLSVTRVSDSQHTVSWTRNSTYTGVVVQRRTDGGDWQEVGRPSGNVASWTDTNTVANRKYEYRVAGLNSNAPNGVGQSEWSAVATVFTTPAPVGFVSAVRDGMDILVDVSGVPPYATEFDVFDGGVLVGSDVTVWPWRHVSPNPAVTHTYRVVSKRGALVSAHSVPSNTVQLQAAPNAPSGLTPNGGVTASGAQVRLAWVHNPVDTTAQTAYELRHRPTGGAWTTVSGTTAGFRDVSLSASSTPYEWQVRTKGDHPDWSPWSAVATVTVVSRPGVAVVAPDDDWDQPVLTVEWTYLQGESRPQSGWRVELLDGDSNRLEFREGSGAQTSLTLAHRVEHGKSYTVNVWGATGTVWSAPASSTFDVVFVEPAPADVSGVWVEESGAVELSVADGRGPVIPDVVNYAPSLYGPTVPVEVRRNLCLRPNVSAASTFSVPSGATSTVVTGGRELSMPVVASGAAAVWGVAASRPTVTPGEAVSLNLRVENTGSLPITVHGELTWYTGGSITGNAPGNTVTIPAGATTELPVNNATVPVDVTSARWTVRAGADFVGGETFIVYDGISIERAPTAFVYSGSTTSPDPDMIPSWVGAVDASESILTGLHPTGFTDANCVSILTADGKELRLIPTGASGESYTQIPVPVAARSAGTWIGTSRLGAPLTGTISSRAFSLWAGTPNFESPRPPNTAGSTDQRLTYGPLTSYNMARLYHGGRAGSGDVYWSKIGLYAGDYDGPAFTGDSGQILVGESVMQTSWDGVPYESPARATMVPAAISFDIDRSVDGETWETVAVGLDGGETQNLTDRESLSTGTTLYRVTAWAVSGAASVLTLPVDCTSDSPWLSAGEWYADAVRLPFNPTVEIRGGRTRTTHYYMGRSRPVAYAGEQTSRVFRISGVTDVNDVELSAAWADLERVAMSPSPLFMWRDPDGRRIYGVIREITQPRIFQQMWGFSFELEETDH